MKYHHVNIFPAWSRLRISAAAALILSMLLLLCACGGDLPADSPETEPVSAETSLSEKQPPEGLDLNNLPETITITYNMNIEGAGQFNDDGGKLTRPEIRFKIRPGDSIAVMNVKARSEAYVFAGWSDGYKESLRRDEVFWEDTTITAIFEEPSLAISSVESHLDELEYYESTFPVVSLYTDNGKPINSKDEYLGCSVSFLNCHYRFERTDLAAGIKGRGNQSWTMAKRSYRVKFATKINALGTGDGEAKDWLLISNHCDQTLLRNWTMMRFNQLLDGMDFALQGQSVDLYINNEYQGVYLLCEHVEVNEARVNIDDTRTDVNNGYLLEWDAYAGGRYGYDYVSASGLSFSIKSTIHNDEQGEYLEEFLTDVNVAIKGGNREEIEALIDVDSFLDMYWEQEFLKNMDVGWSSLYMYIPGGDDMKLYFGPAWDFDLSTGNDQRLDNGVYHFLFAGNSTYNYSQSNKWFYRMMNHKWFQELAIERWYELSDEIDQLKADIMAEMEAHEADYERNFERWPIYGGMQNQEPAAIRKLKSHRAHVEYLVQWIENRRQWINNCFENRDTEDMFAHNIKEALAEIREAEKAAKG